MSTIKVTTEVKRELDRYRKFMLEHEYTHQTATGYRTYLSRFLRQSSHDKEGSLQKSISGFLEIQRYSNPKNFKECRAAVYLYFRMITSENFPKRPPKDCNPEIEAVIKQFYDYSVNIKRIRPNSAIREVASIRTFLEYTAYNATCRPENVTAHSIREFVINRFAHLADSSKGREVTAIRNFFRFQKYMGISVHESVFLLPLSPAVWKNSAFPSTMDESVFNDLCEVPDINTPTGKRNRCIILCFTELALRCAEVAVLTTDDFNWHEGCVAIKNTKNHSDRKLPISEKLGRSIIEYLKNARPLTSDKTLFVRFKHTCGEPMGTSQIRGVVRRVYAKSGADIPSTGTHILRRTAGSKIYNAGNSLKTTADILGHESLDSTVFYVRANIAGLRQVAAPWPHTAGKAGAPDVK
jgi:site-specific recombinase XerD